MATRSIASASVLWVQRTVLPEVSSLMRPAWLVAFTVFSFLLCLFYLLNLGFGSFLVVGLAISQLLLLLHEIFDFLL